MIDKEQVEMVAYAIYTKYFKRGNPAKKMQKIIAAEGIKFREIDGDEKFLGALEQFLGALEQSRKGVWYIFINKDIEHIGRKNFTIAHELGHFVLQHHLQQAAFSCGESEITENNETVSKQEKEANYFASCFLLPKDRIISTFTKWYQWRINPNGRLFLHVDIHKKSYSYWKAISSNLIKTFQVSETALKIRLVNLGLINNF